MSDLNKQRERAKMLLLQKLKNLKISSENAPSVASNSNTPTPIQRPSNSVKQVRQNKPEAKIIKRSQPEEQNHYETDSKKQDKQEEEKVDNLNKDVKKNVRTKRPYYEHYVKQGVFEPILQYVRNHPNPSGKPPNIPPQMYEGIQVVPKRPWVFFGPENIPPSDCQEINQKTFSAIFEKAKKSKGTGVFKKNGKKKGGKRNEDQISQVSDQFTSNFTFSDSVDLSKQSDLISEFRTQTKTMKVYDSGNAEQSQMDDDFSSVSGSVTQRHRYNLFDSSQSEEEKESQSIQVARRRKKFKKLLDSSDEEPSKSSVNKISSFQGSSAILNAGSSGSGVPIVSSKGSSGRVEVDEAESSISKSKSRSQLKAQPAPRRETRRRKPRQLDSDEDE